MRIEKYSVTKQVWKLQDLVFAKIFALFALLPVVGLFIFPSRMIHLKERVSDFDAISLCVLRQVLLPQDPLARRRWRRLQVPVGGRGAAPHDAGIHLFLIRVIPHSSVFPVELYLLFEVGY